MLGGPVRRKLPLLGPVEIGRVVRYLLLFGRGVRPDIRRQLAQYHIKAASERRHMRLEILFMACLDLNVDFEPVSRAFYSMLWLSILEADPLQDPLARNFEELSTRGTLAPTEAHAASEATTDSVVLWLAAPQAPYSYCSCRAV